MGSMSQGFGEAILVLFVALCVALPLALWKLVDIVVWLFSHVHIS